jgi:hypothetical protein
LTVPKVAVLQVAITALRPYYAAMRAESSRLGIGDGSRLDKTFARVDLDGGCDDDA